MFDAISERSYCYTVRLISFKNFIDGMTEAHTIENKTNFFRFFFFLFLGEKCVHIAAEKNHIEILKHLSCIGADINARVSLTHHMIIT